MTFSTKSISKSFVISFSRVFQFSFLIYDLDAHRSGHEPTSLKYFMNRECICPDVVKEFDRLDSFATALSKSVIKQKDLPSKRTFYQGPCPLSLTEDSECSPNNILTWRCAKCLDFLEYGFDDHLYCQCGGANVRSFSYCCHALKHGLNFEPYPNAAVPLIIDGLKSFDGLNFICLGEIGIGKSTFVNGFVNCMTFKTLDDAKKNRALLSPVKTNFRVRDEARNEASVSPLELRKMKSKFQVNLPLKRPKFMFLATMALWRSD